MRWRPCSLLRDNDMFWCHEVGAKFNSIGSSSTVLDHITMHLFNLVLRENAYRVQVGDQWHIYDHICILMYLCLFYVFFYLAKNIYKNNLDENIYCMEILTYYVSCMIYSIKNIFWPKKLPEQAQLHSFPSWPWQMILQIIYLSITSIQKTNINNFI